MFGAISSIRVSMEAGLPGIGRGAYWRGACARCHRPKRRMDSPLRRVADRLDVVSVRIDDEGPVIVSVIFRPETWRAVILSARRERRLVEGAHLGAAARGEGEMNRPRARHAAPAEPELRTALAPHSDPAVAFHDDGDPERR